MKGFHKIHKSVNIKTKEILALEEVADEKIHDSSRMLNKLVDQVLKAVPPDEKNIVKNLKLVLLADEAHDTNTNFRYLDKNGITPGIKIRRKNSIVSPKNNRLRNMEVKLQAKDLLKWRKKKKKRKYGQRWMTETTFSSIKRMFGEYICISYAISKHGKGDDDNSIIV
jgi:hypothetical protein